MRTSSIYCKAAAGSVNEYLVENTWNDQSAAFYRFPDESRLSDLQ